MTKLRRSRFFKGTIAFFLVTAIGTTILLGAEQSTPTPSPEMVEGEMLPGVSLAEGVSQMTGVAISPLLGVSAVGAWKYWRTDESKRHLLPWFCNPVAWGIGLGIIVLCFFKDSIGAAAPPFVKKPLDLIELFESKASAAVASTAFVPFVAKQMSINFSEETAGAAANSEGIIASIPMAFSMHFLLVPLCIFGFLMVWVVSHAINVLILISPFGLIDAFLKASRIFLLSSIAILYAISPVLAALVSLVIIVIAAILAPTAFRLSVFGTVMSVDWLMSFFRKDPSPEKVYGFLAKRGSKTLKTRAFGTISRNDAGQLVFSSKFCFFGPTRSLALPESGDFAMTRGLLYPSVSMADAETEKSRVIVNLLPRYRRQVEETGEKLAIAKTFDSPMTRGIKAMWEWFRDILINSRDWLVDVATDVAEAAKEKTTPPSLPSSES